MSKGLFSKFNTAAPRVEAPQKEGGEHKEKYMRIGTHDCKIIEVEPPAPLPAGRDETWRSVRIFLENAAGEKASHFLEIPTQELEFTGTNRSGGSYTTMAPFNTLVDFLKALGIKEDLGDPKVVGEVLERFFDPANIQRTVGMYVTIALGYRKDSVGADFDYERRVFTLRDANGEIVKDNIGSELTFPDRASAEGWARSNGRNFSKFPQVTKWRGTNGVVNDLKVKPSKKFTAFG